MFKKEDTPSDDITPVDGDATFTEYAPIDESDYTNEDFSKLAWLAHNVHEWNGGSYNYITAIKCDNSTEYSNLYTPMYAKRPRRNERYFSKNELYAIKEHLGLGGQHE